MADSNDKRNKSSYTAQNTNNYSENVIVAGHPDILGRQCDQPSNSQWIAPATALNSGRLAGSVAQHRVII